MHLPANTSAASSHVSFLVHHGIRSPINGLQWGLKTLLRMGNRIDTKIQSEIIEDLAMKTEDLSSVMESMVLCTEMNQHGLTLESINICLQDRVSTDDPFLRIIGSTQTTLSIPDKVLCAFLACCRSLARCAHGHYAGSLFVDEGSDTSIITFSMPLVDLPILHSHSDTTEIGGTPGMHLYFMKNIANTVGYTLTFDQNTDNERIVLTLTLPH